MRYRDRHQDALLHGWEQEVRSLLVHPLAGGRTGLVASAAVAVVAVGASTLTSAAMVAGGGITMTATTTMTASAGWSLNAKIAATALAAALTAGGAAAATGNLPDAMQSFAADAAAHIGIELPRPTVQSDLGVDLGSNGAIDVGGAGSLSAALDGSAGIVITGLDEAAGFTASIVSQTESSVAITFESATEVATVVLNEVDGAIQASVTTEAKSSVGTTVETDDAGLGVEGSTETDVGIELQLGG